MSHSDYARVLTAESAGATAELVELTADENPVVRALTLGALERLGALPDRIVSHALHDASPDVRCRALELAIPRPAMKLVPLLDDPDDLVVETAAWALGERGEASVDTVGRLALTATGHDVSICREAAVAALGALGHPAGLPAILSALSDRAPVRRRAVIALAPFDGPEVRRALERALEDRDRQVRQAAEDLL